MRRFSIEAKESIHVNFDDCLDISYQKRYPSISKKGTSYVFFWFCPLHGHWYSFNAIPGSGEQKDPSASLLSYSNNASDDIFYDFACCLSEYCKKRESFRKNEILS